MEYTQPIIKFNKADQHTMPQYFDYAVALQRVKETLKSKLGADFKQYSTEIEIEEIENTIIQLLTENKDEVELLGTVYDSVASSVIK